MKIHVFKVKNPDKDRPPRILAVPEDQIVSIETVYGSHSTYCALTTFKDTYSLDHNFEEIVKMLDDSKLKTFLYDLIHK